MKSNKRENICDRVWAISGTLRGVGALLQRQSCEIPYDERELFGLGQLFEKLSDNLIEIEDSLRTKR